MSAKRIKQHIHRYLHRFIYIYIYNNYLIMYIYIYMFFMLGLPLKPTLFFFLRNDIIPWRILGMAWPERPEIPPGCWNDWRIYELCCFPQAIAPEVRRGQGWGLGGPWWALVGLDPPVGSHQKNPHEAGENHPPPKKKHHHLEAVYHGIPTLKWNISSEKWPKPQQE